MKIIIVGDGKVGNSLANEFSHEGQDVVVIDMDADKVDDVINDYDVLGLCDNGATYDAQMKAGADKADLLIAVTQNDEVNILCCLLAKKIGTKNTIARVRKPEYFKQLDIMQNGFGIDMLVNPEFEAANEICRILKFPSAIKLETFAQGKVDMAEIAIGEGNKLIGYPISAIHDKYSTQVLVCAVRRGDNITIPNGSFVLQKGDRISVTGKRSEISEFLKRLGIYRNRTSRIMIAGGGKVGYYLAKQLSESSRNTPHGRVYVKVIEKDEARSKMLSEALPKAEVVLGDATDQNTLEEQGLMQQDAFVALMGRDEENAIISMYAASKHVNKVVTKANRMSAEVLESIGLESVISAKTIATSLIARYVRALKNSEGTQVRTLYRIVNGKAEALEFEVPEDFDYINVKFSELKLKRSLMIGCIIRSSRIIFPRGSDSLQAGDTVVVVTSLEGLGSLNDIIA